MLAREHDTLSANVSRSVAEAIKRTSSVARVGIGKAVSAVF
jgi:hypothetical protein